VSIINTEFMSFPDCIDTLLLGFGSVNQHIVKLLLQRKKKRPPLQIIGISDSSGAISMEQGLPLENILAWKQSKRQLCEFDSSDVCHHSTTAEMVQAVAKQGNILLDGTPVNLETGGVGLACCRYALANGIHVVLANKAPLVLAYQELKALAAATPACNIEFSATVCGGLPVVNVGRRDLHCAYIDNVHGIFNSTSNYILSRMSQGETSASALASARERGIAEADPTLDVEGIDSANKLVIICNAMLDYPCTLSDVRVQGIMGVTSEDIEIAAQSGEVYRLVATAAARHVSTDCDGSGGYDLSVEPRRVPMHSFLGSCIETDMCVIMRSDEFETISLKTDEKGVMPTASAMLRDCFTIIHATISKA
jgi:homoserine dehydrogenase